MVLCKVFYIHNRWQIVVGTDGRSAHFTLKKLIVQLGNDYRGTQTLEGRREAGVTHYYVKVPSKCLYYSNLIFLDHSTISTWRLYCNWIFKSQKSFILLILHANNSTTISLSFIASITFQCFIGRC